MCIKLGMPMRFQTETKRHLSIVFKVKLPLASSLNDGNLAVLEKILGTAVDKANNHDPNVDGSKYLRRTW